MQLQNLSMNERLSASAKENKELSADSQTTQLHNQLLMKCIGELTVITKRKDETIEQPRHCIQHAEKLTDIPLPPIEQVVLSRRPFLIISDELLGAHRLDGDFPKQSICCTSRILVLLYVACNIRCLLVWSDCLCTTTTTTATRRQLSALTIASCCSPVYLSFC